MKSYLLFLACLIMIGKSSASTLVEFAPVHSRVLLVHFDDGYVVHHKRGDSRWSNEYAVINPLDTNRVMLPATYLLTGTNGRRIKVVHVSRKSKPTEIALKKDGNNHALEHWVYLYLDSPVIRGEKIILTMELAENGPCRRGRLCRTDN